MNTGSTMLLERVRAATADEYTIEGELGRGGMAAVYLARDIALQRRVAIKVMLPDLIDVEGIEERFVIEARTAAHLDHPGIVTVYSVKQRAGLLFIVMKYIEGRTLESIIEGAQPLDVSVTLSIAAQVAEALHFAHGEGVVHRDVKPSNILIDTRGRPVVTDFGIAKISSGRSLTVTGAMIGTPAYMSPEQCRGLPATTASDQYSLGVMIYEMLARRLPFEGTLFELIHAHSDTAPPPLKDLVPDLDPQLEETVLRMLAKNPRERWPSLNDVAKRLSQVGGGRRSSSEVQASIAELAKAVEKGVTPRRVATLDISGAATEVATTPAPALVITPTNPTIEVGESIRMRVSESSGASLAGVRITWKSEDPSIAVVDESGVVTGRSIGLAKITASGGMAFGRIAVNVRAATVDTLVVTPQSPDLETDNELQLKATALDARGNPVLGQQILWTSSDVSVCAVSQHGRVIATAPGRAEIVANCGGVKGSAHVKVRPPAVERVVVDPGEPELEVEEKLKLSATILGPLDRTLVGRAVAWRSMAPTIVTVTKDGLIEGVSAGTGAVIASCEGKEGIASVTVRAQPVVAVRLQQAKLQLEVGRSMQLQAVAEDRRGRPVHGSGLDWHSDDDQIALIDASGKVHAVREGQTKIRAISGDASSAIEVTVVARPAAQIRIEAHPSELKVGSFLALDATVLDADGAALTGRTVTWSSSDPGIVAVGPDGSCEAKRPGSVRITAACERARGTTKLSVPAVAPAASAGVIRPDDEPPTVIIDTGTLPPPPPPARPAPAATRPVSPPPSVAAPPRTAPAKKSNRALMGGIAVGLIAVIAVAITMFNGPSGDDVQLGGGVGITPPSTGSGGTTGSAGFAGASGETGEIAETGATGSTGDVASTGTTAATGSTGSTGTTTTPTGGTTGNTASTGATGRTGTTGGARGATGATTSTGGTRGTQGATGATTTGRRGGAAPPETTQVNRVNEDSIRAANAAAAAAAEARRRADSVDRARRALLCSNNPTAERALGEALGGDVVSRLTTVYVPRDQQDAQVKSSILNDLRNTSNVRLASYTVLQNEPAGEACDWLVQVRLEWRDRLGRGGGRTYQMRMRLEQAGNEVRAARLFGATPR